jgi:hypothetical protein
MRCRWALMKIWLKSYERTRRIQPSQITAFEPSDRVATHIDHKLKDGITLLHQYC